MINIGEYAAIWEVLNAIMQIDADLGDIVKNVSRNSGNSTYNFKVMEEYINVVGDFKHLSELIKVKIVDKFANKKGEHIKVKAGVNQLKLPAAEYNHIWQVLSALTEQDAELADIVKKLSRESGKGGIHDVFLDDYVSINIPNKELEKLISVKILDQVGDDWEKRYGALIAYKEKHGTALVKIKIDNSLYYWSKAQSSAYHAKTLASYKVRLLEEIGFKWGKTDKIIEEQWWEKFEAIKQFKGKYGHFSVPNNNKSITTQWPCLQRKLYKEGGLSKEKINALNNIGFDWNYNFKIRIDTFWNEQYEIYKDYLKNGTTLPATTYNWAYQIRKAYKAGTLDLEKQKRLKAIDFHYSTAIPPLGRKNLVLLQQFYKENKHWDVPARSKTQKNSLYSWIWKIKIKHKSGKLNKEMENELKNIGFDFGECNKC